MRKEELIIPWPGPPRWFSVLSLLLLVGTACGPPGGHVDRGGPRVEVVVAKMDIDSGKVVGEIVLTSRSVLKRNLTDEMVLASQRSQVLGLNLIDDVKRGEILTWPMLANRDLAFRQSKAVNTSARAMVVAFPHQPGVTRRVLPGDHVDIVAVLKDPQTDELRAVTLLQNIIVLNTGGLDWRPGTPIDARQMLAKPRDTLTLLVHPREVPMLALAQRTGQLYVSLANPEAHHRDKPAHKHAPVTVEDLLKGELSKELHKKRHSTFQRIKRLISLPGLRR